MNYFRELRFNKSEKIRLSLWLSFENEVISIVVVIKVKFCIIVN